MPRCVMLIPLVAVTVAVGQADLAACGDKFLRVGKSARFQRYAAVHPASILIYSPANSTADGIKQLELLLKRAGHTPISVPNGAPLTQTISSGRYDLVIASYVDARRVEESISALPSRPEVLPVLYKLPKEIVAEAEKEFQFLLKPQAMNNAQALAEIDHLMNRTLHGAAKGAASR
jgi:hypothetical protein